jgi:nicotinate dehydrogenase subunit B
VGKTVELTEVDGFLAIGADGSVTVYSGKVDLGTGIRTAMTQIAAEELSVPLDKVEVIEGDTALTPDQGVTFGSLSIQIGGMQIRQAAATARVALMDEGAKRLGLSRDDVIVRLGRVYSRVDGKNVEYGELVGGKNFSLKVDSNATLKDPASYTIVGKPVQRLDIPDKVTASASVRGAQVSRRPQWCPRRSPMQSMTRSACGCAPCHSLPTRCSQR